MIRKTLVVSALAGLLTLGAGAAAADTPPAPDPGADRPPATGPWLPIFYFGTQTYCNQAGMAGQVNGVLTPGRWKCDSGWLLTLPPARR
jgi:hypothetical protein